MTVQFSGGYLPQGVSNAPRRRSIGNTGSNPLYNDPGRSLGTPSSEVSRQITSPNRTFISSDAAQGLRSQFEASQLVARSGGQIVIGPQLDPPFSTQEPPQPIREEGGFDLVPLPDGVVNC